MGYSPSRAKISEDCVDIDGPSGFIYTSLNFSCVWNSSHHPNQSQDGDAAGGAAGGAAAVLRIGISLVYCLVCVLGLVGNVLVLHLVKSKQISKESSINLFVTSLALTAIQFVVTLPFWAVENALDFTWLFGNVMCKVKSYVTAMNMYARVVEETGAPRGGLLEKS
uniref:G-protein coupled receptors family 1 profile domain-containing protein n=1 Tax=Knipowitschia caucasica TaxID=637954 RepID=A0AAV2J1C3_KNICA